MKFKVFYSNGKQKRIPRIIELPRTIISFVLLELLLNANLIVKNDNKANNITVKAASLLVKSSAGNRSEPSYPKMELIPTMFDIKYKTLLAKTAMLLYLPSVVMKF